MMHMINQQQFIYSIYILYDILHILEAQKPTTVTSHKNEHRSSNHDQNSNDALLHTLDQHLVGVARL